MEESTQATNVDLSDPEVLFKEIQSRVCLHHTFTLRIVYERHLKNTYFYHNHFNKLTNKNRDSWFICKALVKNLYLVYASMLVFDETFL